MLILALETSTEAGSCALWQDGKVIERRCPAGQSHSATLLPLVRELLAEAACRIGKGDSCNLRALRGGLTRAHTSHPLHIAASLGCLVDLGEVTSLDVGLVALHQAQRYAVLR